MPLKIYFIKYRSRRALRKNKIVRENPSFVSSRRIGIIFTWEGQKKFEIIEQFRNELELSGKKTKMIAFHNEKITPNINKLDFFCLTDFSPFGSIKSERLRYFSRGKFDFLFHLDTTQNTYIEYIMALSQAKCRVSRVDYSRKDFYDFMIKSGESEGIEQLCKQILFYTKSLVSYA